MKIDTDFLQKTFAKRTGSLYFMNNNTNFAHITNPEYVKWIEMKLVQKNNLLEEVKEELNILKSKIKEK